MTGIAATAITHTKQFIFERYGQGKWDEIAQNLELSTKELYQRDLNPRSWVDYDRVVDLLRSVKQIFGDEGAQVLYALGRHNGEANIRLTQHIIMKLDSVEHALQIAARLWKGRVRDGGTLKILRKARGHVKLVLADFPDPTLEWHEYLVGFFERTLELSGGQVVKVELAKSGTKPFDNTEFDIKWE